MEKKSKVLKTLVAFFIVVLFDFSCERKTPTKTLSNVNLPSLDTLYLKQTDVLHFKYDNNDPSKFGIEYFEHGFPVSEPSLALDNQVVYVVDAFHNNIKKIDLLSGNVRSSNELSQKRLFLNDIIVFKDVLYISSELDTIFILSKELSFIKKFSPKKGRSSFSRSYGNDSLVLFYPDSQEYLTVDKDDEVVKKKIVSYEERGEEVYFKNKMVKNIDKNLFQTTFGIVSTEEDLFQNEIDFDSVRLVAIRQDTSNFTLSILSFQR